MELAFREDVVNRKGEIKFPAGVLFEWPKATFQEVAKSLGRPLAEVTVTKAELGQVFADRAHRPSAEKTSTTSGQGRVRLRLSRSKK